MLAVVANGQSTEQRQLQLLAAVSLSWEVFTPELLVPPAPGMSWFWEEVLWVKGQEKTKNSGDRKAGVEVALGTSLG